MTLDPDILREAKAILNLYATPQQELIKKNLYGPLEARLAGAIVHNSFTVVSHSEPTETEALQELRDGAWEQITELCRLLREASAIIEERVAGNHTELLEEIDGEIVQAEENFTHDVEDENERTIVVVVFPTLDHADGAVAAQLDEFVKTLNALKIKTWVADESDHSRRLKAMTIREIYNIGRVAAVVLTTVDGIVLDGWYNGLPWVNEVTDRVRKLGRP